MVLSDCAFPTLLSFSGHKESLEEKDLKEVEVALNAGHVM